MRTLTVKMTVLLLAVLVVAGCGYSEQEWQAQLDKYSRLQSKNQDNERELARVNKELKLAVGKITALQNSLKELIRVESLLLEVG